MKPRTIKPGQLRLLAKGSSAWLGIALATIVLFIPDARLKHPRVRSITKTLRISTSKTNPPRLAFEEALQIRVPSLRAPAARNEPQSRSLNEMIARQQLRPTRLALYYRHVQLGPMIIDRREVVIAPVVREARRMQVLPQVGRLAMKMSDVLPGRDIPERRFEPNMSTTDPEYNPAADNEWFASLSPRQRNLLEASGLRTTDLATAPLEPSLAESLAAKVEEELKRIQDGGVIITPQAATPAVPSNPSLRTDDKTPQNESKDKKDSYRVAGHVDLDSQTALLPGEHIEVAWKRDGQNRRSGRVAVPGSQFSIEVDELVGAVVLEKFDRSGGVTARGSVRLSPDLSQEALTHLQLRLRPVDQVASTFADFYNSSAQLFNVTAKKTVWKFGKKPIRTKASFDDASVFEADSQGQLFIDGISGGSSSFAMTESDDHYPALHMVTAGQKESLPLIPKKTAQAMMAIIEEQLGYTDVQKNGAIVMGQVTGSGQPLAGVQVEIEGHPEARAIYLNEILIPDPQLKATSSTGYFVFLHLPQGFYSLRAARGPQFVGYGNVVNEPEAAAFIEIQEPLRFAPIEVRAFDAFTGDPQAADLAIQALSQNIQIDGYAQLDHPIVAKYSLMDVEPKSDLYLPAMYPYAGDSEFLHLPMIPRVWMETLLIQGKISPNPGEGAIVGFSEKGGYEIQLPHLPEDTKAQVIYFDAQGQRTPASVENGGFVLMNLPATAQTVVLHHAMGGVVSRVLNVDPERLTISRFDF